MSFRVLRGAAAVRPRWFRGHGHRDCVHKGVSFRVLRGPAAAQPRRCLVHGTLVDVQEYAIKGLLRGSTYRSIYDQFWVKE